MIIDFLSRLRRRDAHAARVDLCLSTAKDDLVRWYIFVDGEAHPNAQAMAECAIVTLNRGRGIRPVSTGMVLSAARIVGLLLKAAPEEQRADLLIAYDAIRMGLEHLGAPWPDDMNHVLARCACFQVGSGADDNLCGAPR